MYELSAIIPDVNDLLALEPEELGAKLLFLMRRRVEDRTNPFNNNGLLSCGNMQSEPFDRHPLGNFSPYPDWAREQFQLAFAEAWSWLEAQGLIVPASGMNGSHGWRVLSRRARKFEDETAVARFATARMLPKEILNPRIATTVWSAFMRGEYDVAAFQAMKGVEVAVREGAAMPQTLLGVRLMRAAFAPKIGPLSDSSVDEGEQVARMELFAGAIGSYKNPHSHRNVPLDDPVETIEIVLLANHLLRIVDARVAAKAQP